LRVSKKEILTTYKKLSRISMSNHQEALKANQCHLDMLQTILEL
jgi:hypothetical protein